MVQHFHKMNINLRRTNLFCCCDWDPFPQTLSLYIHTSFLLLEQMNPLLLSPCLKVISSQEPLADGNNVSICISAFLDMVASVTINNKHKPRDVGQLVVSTGELVSHKTIPTIIQVSWKLALLKFEH